MWSFKAPFSQLVSIPRLAWWLGDLESEGLANVTKAMRVLGERQRDVIAARQAWKRRSQRTRRLVLRVSESMRRDGSRETTAEEERRVQAEIVTLQLIQRLWVQNRRPTFDYSGLYAMSPSYLFKFS